MSTNSHARTIRIGVLVAFVCLVAAIWASGASTATALAVTGLLVLIGVAVFAAAERTVGEVRGPVDAADPQRERMGREVP